MLHLPRLRAQRAPAATGLTHAIAPAAAACALERALLAALGQRRPHLLNHLVDQAGPQAFAQALATLDARQMMDALCLLADAPRAAVCAHLPPSARRRWPTAQAPRPRGWRGLLHRAFI